MSERPVIFISAVSKELKTARGFASRLLHSMGYDPKDEDMARTEHGSLREILRNWIDRSEGVIQLVGQCRGAEPREPDAEFGRCSYTEFEALYARKTGKPLWYFFAGDGFPSDAHDPEPADIAALQQAYIARIHAGGDLRHRFATDAELEVCLRRIEDHLDELCRAWQNEQRRTRRFRVFAGIGILLLLALGIASVPLSWLLKKDAASIKSDTTEIRTTAGETRQAVEEVKHDTAEIKSTAARTESKVDALTQAAKEFIQRNAADAVASGGKEDALRRTLLFAELEKKYGLPAGTLAERLPELARKLAEDAAIPKLDRARAALAALDYAEAEHLALEAYAEAKKSIPLDKHQLIEALEVAGESAGNHADFHAALAHYTDASKLTDKTADPLEWARVHNGLADALNDNGQAAQAFDLLREVNEIRSKNLGNEHPDTLMSRSTLALMLIYLGKHAEAEAENRAVLGIRERVLGVEHPDTLISRNNLGGALSEQGKFAEAAAEYRAVLAIQQRVLGGEHPDTLGTRNNVAQRLVEQGKIAEGEAEHRAVLAIKERVLRAEHPDTLLTRHNLAYVMSEQGKHREAEAALRAVSAARRRVLGAEHPHTLLTRHLLANALAAQRKFADAEAEYRAVLEIRERVLGAEHPDTLRSRYTLAVAWNIQGKYTKAEPELRAVLAIQERVLGREHPDVAESCFHLAFCFEPRKRLSEALTFIRRAESIWGKVLGLEHPCTKDARTVRARIEAALARGGTGKKGGVK